MLAGIMVFLDVLSITYAGWECVYRSLTLPVKKINPIPSA